ncbi:MAG: hypothetical protein V3U21_02960, partial [Thermodesulfobacteriota bacterium]
ASPFEEDFIIYELGNPSNVYMEGWNSGVVIHANKAPDGPSMWLANGKIEEAYEPFAMWEGRNVQFKGIVVWESLGVPDYATSTFRIN